MNSMCEVHGLIEPIARRSESEKAESCEFVRKFRPWISGSGAEVVRRPAWDYAIDSGPQKTGERRRFLVRLVYKPFAGLDDVLREVERFDAHAAPGDAPLSPLKAAGAR